MAKRFAPYGVALLVLVVGAVGGWSWWQAREAARLADIARAFQGALRQAEAGDPGAAARAAAAIAERDGGAQAMLARLFEAARLAEVGQTEQALAHLDRIAGDSAIEPVFRDLALLRGALLRVDHEDPASFRQRIQPLLAPDQPFRFTGRELAALSSLRAGDMAAAREHLKRVTDDASAPAGARARASELLASLGG